MHSLENNNQSATRRLRYALLLSLILHGLLLFFVRVAQPAWKNYSGGNIALHVTLSAAQDKALKPSSIEAASQNDQGTAKTGVEDNQQFPEKALTATTRTPVNEFRTDISKSMIGRKVMTVKKSEQKNRIETAPELLVTQALPPVTQAPETEPFAPAPSVEKPPEPTQKPTQKLVSVTPAEGEKHDNIVVAESAQAKLPAEQPTPAAEAPKPVEEPKPVKVEEPKPVKVEEPKPVKVEEPKPAKVEEPKPAKTEEPNLAKAEEPRPTKAVESAPSATEEARSARTTEPAPAKSGSADSGVRAPARGDSDVFRAASAIKAPGIADLNLSSIRKFAGDSDRKIKFGERRKTIDMKEQDIRYVMYIESVRLKLQRIGQLNYPAAAARESLSGTLAVIITIRADGSLEDFSIARPSAYDVFNTGAERIVRMSAPFSPLPDSIRQDTDVLSIRINWNFSRAAQSFD